MSNDLLIVTVVAWFLGALIALTGRGLPLVRGLLVLGGVAGIIAAIMALPDGTAAVELPTQLAGAPVIFQIAPEAAWLLGFGLATCGARLRAGDAGGARPGRLAVRRRYEPRRGPRCFRAARRCQLSYRLGDHEFRRRRNDTLRKIIASRPAGIVHARTSRSRRGRASRGDSASCRKWPFLCIRELRRRGGQFLRSGYSSHCRTAHYRLRRQARSVAVLRMVPGRLWRRQRRVRRVDVRRSAQRRVLRLEPRPSGMGARPERRCRRQHRCFSHRRRRAQRRPHGSLCVSAGGLAHSC